MVCAPKYPFRRSVTGNTGKLNELSTHITSGSTQKTTSQVRYYTYCYFVSVFIFCFYSILFFFVSCTIRNALHNATLLQFAQFLFRRNFNWCPTFCKLKKLVLDDWCVAVDMGALICILKHSPVLENLNIRFRMVYSLNWKTIKVLLYPARLIYKSAYVCFGYRGLNLLHKWKEIRFLWRNQLLYQSASRQLKLNVKRWKNLCAVSRDQPISRRPLVGTRTHPIRQCYSKVPKTFEKCLTNAYYIFSRRYSFWEGTSMIIFASRRVWY
jgi:hypothetical protein